MPLPKWKMGSLNHLYSITKHGNNSWFNNLMHDMQKRKKNKLILNIMTFVAIIMAISILLIKTIATEILITAIRRGDSDAAKHALFWGANQNILIDCPPDDLSRITGISDKGIESSREHSLLSVFRRRFTSAAPNQKSRISLLAVDLLAASNKRRPDARNIAHDIALSLVDAGARCDGMSGAIALNAAARASFPDIETVIIKRGAQCQISGADSALNWATNEIDVDTLIQNGASIGFVDRDKNTPLDKAICEFNTDKVRWLIKHGAPTAEVDPNRPLGLLAATVAAEIDWHQNGPKHRATLSLISRNAIDLALLLRSADKRINTGKEAFSKIEDRLKVNNVTVSEWAVPFDDALRKILINPR